MTYSCKSSEGSGVAELAERAAALSLEDVPAATRAHAAAVFADTVGVMVGGGRNAALASFVAGDGALFQRLPAGPCDLFTPGAVATPPELAAFVNGTAGTFLELDEGVRPTGHPAVHVVPAALAAAQALHAPGDRLLAAILSGYEVVARLFRAYRLRYPLHPHGHLGAVGAAVAVARLADRPAGPSAEIAATLPLLSVWTSCFEGATARNAYSGMAASVGVTANRLAASGFTGSAGALDTAFGELVGELHDPEALTAPVDPCDLGIERDYLKVYSACALAHTAIEATLELGPLPERDITGIVVETVANNLKLARQARPNELSTRFSLPYAVAAAIVHRHAGPDAFVPDERVFALARRIEVREADDLTEAWPDASPARVTVQLADGARTARVDNARGHWSRPATAAELREKFVALTHHSGADAPRYDYDRLIAIEQVADTAELFG